MKLGGFFLHFSRKNIIPLERAKMAARFINCLKPLFPFMKLCCSYIHKSPCPAPVTSGPANRRITDRAWRMKTVMMMVLLPMCPFHSSTRLTRLVVLKPCLLFFLLCYFTLFVILPLINSFFYQTLVMSVGSWFMFRNSTVKHS